MSVVKRESYPRWLSALGRATLRMLGWRWEGVRPDTAKCVITCAPHSTNWDLFFFLLGTLAYNLPAMFTMKRSWFFWPLGILWRWLGGIPIDRSKRTNTVDQMIAHFDGSEVLRLGIPPEGTRKGTIFWKTGFYWVARGAGVPIVMACIDYRNKAFGIAAPLYPTEDPEADFAAIRTYYEEKTGVRPRFRILEKKPEATQEPQTPPCTTPVPDAMAAEPPPVVL